MFRGLSLGIQDIRMQRWLDSDFLIPVIDPFPYRSTASLHILKAPVTFMFCENVYGCLQYVLLILRSVGTFWKLQPRMRAVENNHRIARMVNALTIILQGIERYVSNRKTMGLQLFAYRMRYVRQRPLDTCRAVIRDGI
jgi:hypothetical protein